MTLRFSLAAGIVVGLVLGAVRGALFLAYIGFWGGLMWLLLVGGPLGLILAARKQYAAAALTFAAAIAAGLMPGAI